VSSLPFEMRQEAKAFQRVAETIEWRGYAQRFEFEIVTLGGACPSDECCTYRTIQ